VDKELRRVIIMRGVPGSGKSTMVADLAKWLVHEGDSCAVCSADDYFMVREEPSGPLVYRFNPAKIAEAHAACMSKFLESLSAGVNLVIVDNTNIREWEYRNYVLAARLARYEVSFRECKVETVSEIRACAARNTHGVPLEIIARMAVEYE